MIPVRTNVRGAHSAVATIVLMVICVVVFVLQLELPPEHMDAFVTEWGSVPSRLFGTLQTEPKHVELWLLPLFSSMFLHGGWGHLVGNMLFLWVFGRSLESRVGTVRFTVLYFVGGIAAAITQAAFAATSNVPMIGASGAIAAVLGAYFVAYPKSKVTVVFPIFIFPFFFDLHAIFFLGVWFFEQIFSGTLWALSPLAAQAGGVAWFAHIGGFLAGVGAGIFARISPTPPPRRHRRAPDAYVVWH
jgi:membrane associated rhomboid family serine protease